MVTVIAFPLLEIIYSEGPWGLLTAPIYSSLASGLCTLLKTSNQSGLCGSKNADCLLASA